MSAHAAAAMSNAVLNSLNRLSDGHTRRTAWNELTTFAEQLDAQRLPGFLACLHATNDRYTIACRRGVIHPSSSTAASAACTRSYWRRTHVDTQP